MGGCISRSRTASPSAPASRAGHAPGPVLQENPPAAAGPSQVPAPPGGLHVRSQAGASMPPRQQLGPGSPMLQALRRGDTGMLRTLYQQEAAGRTPLDVWRDASARGRHDLQHAVLVLHRHESIEAQLAHTPRETAPGEPRTLNAELHRPLGTKAHAELIDHVKQFPYYSEKAQRLTFDNLNCKVPFTDGGDVGCRAIECRHLATAWALQAASGKPDYASLRDADGVQRSVPFSMQPLYQRLMTSAPENHLVALKGWGSFIASQLRDLAATGEEASRRMLFGSGNHMMAMELKVKPGASGCRYVANFYDPNVTAAHKRVASGDLRQFESLRMDKVFSSPQDRDNYFKDESVAMVTVVPDGGEPSIPPLKPGGDPERRLSGELPPLDESIMNHLMHGGFAGTLRDILPAFAELARKAPHEAVTLLAGRANDNAGLCAAMFTGQAHAVHAFSALMALVPPSEHAWLLAARGANDIPALQAGITFKHAPAVRAFIDAVAASAVPPAEQVKLLAAQLSVNGLTALAVAMGRGHLDSVNAYLDGLAAHQALGAEHKVALLSLEDGPGLPALARGLLQGPPDTAAALTGWIARQDFSAEDRRHLLVAPDRRGTPALVHLLHEEAADNVRAYVSAVLDSPMEEADKLHVLAAGEDPADWRQRAAAHEGSVAMAAYRNAVRQSSLPPAAQERLLG
jgi:uncharacterized protein